MKQPKSIIAAALFMLPMQAVLLSCTDEIDESNLYTFTGETIEDYITNRDEFSSFNYILQRSGLNRIMSAYGQYTCFAPNNDAVAIYIDSLWNDTENEYFEHNGMTENSLEGLSDSLCTDIAEFHLCNSVYDAIDLAVDGSTLSTMLGRSITTSLDSAGASVLNNYAVVTSVGNEVTNGVVHEISQVIPRSNRLMTNELESQDNFTIFAEALEKTGLGDSLLQTIKNIELVEPPSASEYYTPDECKIGYTLFAESDYVMSQNGINSFSDLVDYANEIYGSASTGEKSTESSGWYDYYRNNNIEVSTGKDYTERNNALNMFVSYHLLSYAVNSNILTSNRNVWAGNGYNGDTFEYYETMLPKTLIKVWKLGSNSKYYLNRYQKNNTLTDGVETMGSASMHTLVRTGVQVYTDSLLSPLNGYIYPINNMLVYDYWVPKGVLNERMRMDALSFMPESMDNGFRGMNTDELTGLNGGMTAKRVRYPYNYFDYLISYNGNNTTLDQNVPAPKGVDTYALYQGDSFQGVGQYDLAIKLPPIPDGTYELRVNCDMMSHGSMLQFYLGTSSERSTMEAISIPMDMRVSPFDYELVNAHTGWTKASLEADKGIATDADMRVRGYMRDPLSMAREANYFVFRFEAYQMRRILLKYQFKQQDYWLRMKTVLPDVTEGKFQLDFVEFVPINVAESEEYLEDMY